MWAIVFLIISFLVGFRLMARARKWVGEAIRVRGFSGKQGGVGEMMILLPGGFLVGILLSGWLVYLLSLFLSVFIDTPLAWGNVLGVVVLLAALCSGYLRETKFKKFSFKGFEWLVPVVVGLGFMYLFYYTFRVEGGRLLVGSSVYSDFGPHVALIRSFSLGNNFPTVYPHFPAGDVRYHFMFDFMVGNLEFLGMRIDHAFNVLSLLAMVSMTMLLFGLAVMMSGQRAVGYLTLLLWFSRSSPAIFSLAVESSDNLIGSFLGLNRFIGRTAHEDWGLWNQNVYLNQRHLAFGWAILLLGLIMLLPLWMERKGFWQRLKARTVGWSRTQWGRVLFVGVILGGLGFFNGAAVISGLLILGVLMVFSKNKQEYLGIMVLALSLVAVQKWLFIRGEALSPKFLFGFLADEKQLRGVLVYWVELLGVWVFALTGSLLVIKRRYWGIVAAFAAPLVFANLVSLTPDIAVNHKYVMLSVVLLNVFVAYFVVRVWESGVLGKVVAGGLVVLLCATGVADLVAVLNINRKPLVYAQTGEYFDFLKRTDKREVFLSDEMPVLDEVLLSGRRTYFGWPYFAWSAGYNTDVRNAVVAALYEMEDGEELAAGLRGEGIDYVVYRSMEPKNMMTAGLVLQKVYEDSERTVFGVR